MLKKYKLLPSKNRVLCDGRCIIARDVNIFIFALLLIIVTSSLFFAFDCRYLSLRLSPAIPVIGGLLFIFVISVMFRVACSDPGIIPRATPEEVIYLEKSDMSNSPQSVSLASRIVEVQVNGQTIQLKFCQTCKMYRPPRTSHCSICDNCVACFDHHCPWIANCIGKRNYRYFYLFLLSLAILCLYIFAFNVTNVVLRSQEKNTFIDAIKDTPATMVEAIICFFSVWSIFGLCGYHSYLLMRGVTTNEDIKDTWNRSERLRPNPFSSGNPIRNCFSSLCGPVSPSLLDLRGTVRPENQTSSTLATNGTTVLYKPNDNGFYGATDRNENNTNNNTIWSSSTNYTGISLQPNPKDFV